MAEFEPTTIGLPGLPPGESFSQYARRLAEGTIERCARCSASDWTVKRVSTRHDAFTTYCDSCGHVRRDPIPPLRSIDELVEPKRGWIYFIRARRWCKIGYATDVAARLADLQCANPDRLELLAIMPGTVADERRLHAALDHYRLRPNGEWFELEAVEALLEAGATDTPRAHDESHMALASGIAA